MKTDANGFNALSLSAWFFIEIWNLFEVLEIWFITRSIIKENVSWEQINFRSLMNDDGTNK